MQSARAEEWLQWRWKHWFWSALRIEKDRYVVGGKGASSGRWACANYGLMILTSAGASLELGRDLIQAGSGVTHNEPGLTGACVACAHHAGLASIIGRFSDFHSCFGENAGHSVLLLVEREGLNGAGKIFYGVELVVSIDYRDTDGIDVWIQ